jgi:hypothetical protein
MISLDLWNRIRGRALPMVVPSVEVESVSGG